MESLQMALNAVLPIFIFLVLGYVLNKMEMLDNYTLNKMNQLCFQVLVAVSVYYNIYKIENLKEIFDIKLFVYAVATQLAIWAISFFVGCRVEKTNRRRSALAHSMFHTNLLVFGTLIGTALCGENQVGVIVLLMVLIVSVQNILSVVLLELLRENGIINWWKIFLSVIKNPYVAVAAVGLMTQFLHIHFPEIIDTTIRDLGRCGTPISLIVMGGLFNFGTVKHNVKSIVTGGLFRLILFPAIFLFITAALGFRGTAFVGLMCLFITPTGTSSFNLACAMDSDADLTSQLIVFTSFFSLISIFLWIFSLGKMNLY